MSSPRKNWFGRALDAVAETETNPLALAWRALPPNVRATYASLPAAIGELSPGAAVRDTVQASGETAKAAMQGRGWDAVGGVANMLAAAAGVVPGGRLITKGAKELAQPIRGYHGSPNQFDKFDIGKAGTTTDQGELGRALYFGTDPNVAANRPHKYEAAVSLENPLNLTMPNFRTNKSSIIREALGLPPTATSEEITQAATRRGHDGVILDYSPTGYAHKEIAAFSDKAIEILRKYGLLPVAAGGAAVAANPLSTGEEGAY